MLSHLRKGTNGAELHANTAVDAIAVELKDEIVEVDRVLGARTNAPSAMETFVHVDLNHVITP